MIEASTLMRHRARWEVADLPPLHVWVDERHRPTFSLEVPYLRSVLQATSTAAAWLASPPVVEHL